MIPFSKKSRRIISRTIQEVKIYSNHENNIYDHTLHTFLISISHHSDLFPDISPQLLKFAWNIPHSYILLLFQKDRLWGNRSDIWWHRCFKLSWLKTVIIYLTYYRALLTSFYSAEDIVDYLISRSTIFMGIYIDVCWAWRNSALLEFGIGASALLKD